MSKYFIYTGNAYPHKNLSRLVLLKTNLRIVSGRSVFIERLENEIKLKNAEKYVEVLGFVDDDDLTKLYKDSVAFVFPTLAEGFGLPPMEAINAGTLAVVSEIPVLKEVYEDSVFYFDPLNVNSIKNALEKILKIKDEEKEKIIAKSQKFLKRYSWLKMAKETLEVYKLIKT